jgi:xylulose-5-phosphate/fructose-6-phosphate phosphoketolase
VAYGSVMDQPDLISIAVIGDGEAETGPTATYVADVRVG